MIVDSPSNVLITSFVQLFNPHYSSIKLKYQTERYSTNSTIISDTWECNWILFVQLPAVPHILPLRYSKTNSRQSDLQLVRILLVPEKTLKIVTILLTMVFCLEDKIEIMVIYGADNESTGTTATVTQWESLRVKCVTRLSHSSYSEANLKSSGPKLKMIHVLQ